MNPLKLIAILSILLIPFINLKGQNIGVGASAIYNIQSESFGAGVRGTLFPNKRISYTPQFSYFFPFNKVHEYTIGLGVEAKLLRRRRFNIYGLLHGGYNRWISHNSSPLKDAKASNWNFEGGLGISTNKCLRPFLEYRYNVKFRETHLNLGLLYIFGCKSGKFMYDDKCPDF